MDERIQIAGQKCDEYRVSGYRCSESLIRGCADAMGIVLSDEILRVTGGFGGGGGGAHEACGLLEAGVALISLLYGRSDKSEDDNGCYYLIRIYHEKFRRAFGTVSCRELRPKYYYLKGFYDCAPNFPKAAQILTSILVDAERLVKEMPDVERILPHNPNGLKIT
ncbi:MAG: C_GCAxxG_C_C family protein [Clostridiales bacterium]|nr:C_GCAxxG_C_C family protein [Clostridiales bacterium]